MLLDLPDEIFNKVVESLGLEHIYLLKWICSKTRDYYQKSICIKQIIKRDKNKKTKILFIPPNFINDGNIIHTKFPVLKYLHIDDSNNDNFLVYYSCPFLKKVKLPNSVTQLKSSFKERYLLEEVILPNKLESIPDETFLYCYQLKTIILPDTITSIGKSSFSYCKNLETIILPDKLSNIGSFCFCRCEKLRNIRIPKNIEHLPRGILDFCLRLKKVEFYELKSFININNCTSNVKFVKI